LLYGCGRIDVRRVAQTRGIYGAVWFGFEFKSHSNQKINKYAVWFDSVDF